MTPRISSRRIAVLAVIALAMLAMLWLVVAVGVAGITRFRAPAVAMALWPGDSRATAVQASLLITQELRPADLARAEALARQSIARDPTFGVAWRVLGFVADARRQRPAAARLMKRSEQLSRRDLATELWLIDYEVARNDVAGALRHFDIALRTSATAPQILFPVLREAISDDRLLMPIARVLAQRPEWRDRFLRDAIDSSTSLSGLAGLSLALDRVGAPLAAEQRQQLDNRFVDARAYALVKRVNRLPSAGQFVVDPGFERSRDSYRFGWTLPSGDGPFVERLATPTGRGIRLNFSDTDGGGGLVAQQVLVLAPGRYRLSYEAGLETANAGSGPVWGINCGDRGGTAAATIPIVAPSAGGRYSSPFTIPATRCSGQLLVLVTRPTGNERGTVGWVDNVTIVAE